MGVLAHLPSGDEHGPNNQRDVRILKYQSFYFPIEWQSLQPHAAGLVISAPIAIIDPKTQDHYGDHFDQFAQSIPQIKNSEPIFALGRNQLFGACRRMTDPASTDVRFPPLLEHKRTYRCIVALCNWCRRDRIV